MAHERHSCQRRHQCTWATKLLHLLAHITAILLHSYACLALAVLGQDVHHATSWSELVHLGGYGCQRIWTSYQDTQQNRERHVRGIRILLCHHYVHLGQFK